MFRRTSLEPSKSLFDATVSAKVLGIELWKTMYPHLLCADFSSLVELQARAIIFDIVQLHVFVVVLADGKAMLVLHVHRQMISWR